ncbi:MAG: hypothetical protein ACK4FN_00100 [Acinetobacter johnsonii]
MKIQTQYGEVHVLTNCPLLDSTERLEFKTEVHESFDGSEDRYIQRDAPRQVLSFNYVNMQKAMGDIFHMLYANLRNLWGVPLPQFRQVIPDLEDSDFIIMETTTHRADLRVGFILLESSEGAQTAEIVSIGRYIITQEEIRDPETDEILQALETEYQDGFRLAQNVTVSNASIMPLRICIIDGDASISTGGFWSNSSMVFRVLAEDSPEHSGDVPEQYRGEDIYFKPLLLDGDSLEMTLMQHQNIVDADVGGFQQFTHWKKPRYLKPFKSVLRGWDKYTEYRRVFFGRIGRYKTILFALYLKKLKKLKNANNTNKQSTNTKYLLEADRKHIAVKRKNGTWTAHEITAKTGGSLTVSPAINAHRNDIQTICYLGLHRFDADHIEFQFLGAQITQVTVPIVELSS